MYIHFTAIVHLELVRTSGVCTSRCKPEESPDLIKTQHESLINNSKALPWNPWKWFFHDYLRIHSHTSMWCTFANHLLTNVQMVLAHTSAHVYLREVWLGIGLLPPPDCVRVFGSGWETEFGGRGGDRISRETEWTLQIKWGRQREGKKDHYK